MEFSNINPSIWIRTDSNSIAKNIEIQDRRGHLEFGGDLSTPEEVILKSVDRPVAHHVCLATHSALTSRCPRRVDQRTVEDLRAFLQDTARTVQSLVNRHNSICENDKACVTDCADVETSMSLAMPSTFQPDRRVGNSRQATTGIFNEDAKLLKTQDWIYQGWAQEDKALKSGMFEIHLSNKRGFSEEKSQDHQFDASTVDTLRGFLEEMKNTIQSWSSKFKLLVQSHFISPRENAESIVGPLLSSEFPSIAFGEPHLQLRLQDMDAVQSAQPGHPDQEGTYINQVAHSDHMTADAASMRPNSMHGYDHEEANEVQLFQPSHLDGNMSELSQLDRLTEPDEGKKKLLFLSPVQPNARALVIQSSQAAHSEVHTITQIDHSGLDTRLAPQLDTGNVEVAFLPQTKQEHGIVESAGGACDVEIQGTGNGEYNNSIVQLKAGGSGEDSGEKQVTIQHQQRELQVVQSPDWLPEGWMTEIKLRVTGNSAGARDKYFVDPVTKRRFRSKKEVFCFLETGTLGRYKPKSRNKVDGKKAGRAQSSALKKAKRNLLLQSSGCLSAGLATSPLSLPSDCAPTSVSAAGMFSSVLLPYRPGQSAEWVAYESLSSLPIPVFEHVLYPEKDSTSANGSKASSHGQWVFSNVDPAWSPYPQRKKKYKAVDEPPTNLECAGETINPSKKSQKYSFAGTRNSCQKTST